jgi:hypothetical protein
MNDRNGLSLSIGCPVVASHDETGEICEGNVEWVWEDSNGVVIRDHESKRVQTWNRKYVDRLDPIKSLFEKHDAIRFYATWYEKRPIECVADLQDQFSGKLTDGRDSRLIQDIQNWMCEMAKIADSPC